MGFTVPLEKEDEVNDQIESDQEAAADQAADEAEDRAAGPQHRGTVTMPLKRTAHSPEKVAKLVSLLEMEEHSFASFLETGSHTRNGPTDSASTPIRSHHVVLEDLRDSEYAIEIGVGTPPQLLSVILDTGSSNIWVNAESCQSESCRAHRRFNPAKSSTYHELDSSMSVKYGSGSLKGDLVTEAVSIGPVRVTGQTVGLIQVAAGASWMSSRFDGILGLAFEELSVTKRPLLLDTMASQHVLEHTMISFFYSDTPDMDSAVAFGEPDKHFMRSAITWVDVSRAMYWEVPLNGWWLAGQKLTGVDCARAVLDTGTSYFTAPRHVVDAIRRQLPPLHRDCSNFDQLPVLTVQLGDTKFDIEPRYYVERKYNGQSCFLAIVALDVPPPRGPLVIMGDMFMRKYYTTFDHDKKRLGFSLSANTDADRKQA